MASEPDLYKGDSGEWVQHLQQLMTDGGYWDGPVDGTFDDAFEQAVVALQDGFGLPATGVVDALTWAAFEPAPATGQPVLARGSTGEWVVYAQQMMQFGGAWAGPLDGSFDDAFEQAVVALQYGYGLPQTGAVDDATWTTLAALPPAAPRTIAEWTATEKLIEAYNRADIGDAVFEKLNSMMTPEALVTSVAVAVGTFAVVQFTPVGWAADLALLATAVFASAALANTLTHLWYFAAARDATTEEELDRAGEAFAAAVAEIGVDGLLFILARGAAGAAAGRTYNGPPPSGVVLATTADGQLALVAVETVPVEVAVGAGLDAGAAAWLMASRGPGGRRWQDMPEDEIEDVVNDERISSGPKVDLDHSEYLQREFPDPADLRRFKEWLQDGHREGLPHDHYSGGGRDLENAVREFKEGGWLGGRPTIPAPAGEE